MKLNALRAIGREGLKVTAHWAGTRAFSKGSEGEQSISSTADWAGAARGSDSSFDVLGCHSLGSADPSR